MYKKTANTLIRLCRCAGWAPVAHIENAQWRIFAWHNQNNAKYKLLSTLCSVIRYIYGVVSWKFAYYDICKKVRRLYWQFGILCLSARYLECISCEREFPNYLKRADLVGVLGFSRTPFWLKTFISLGKFWIYLIKLGYHIHPKYSHLLIATLYSPSVFYCPWICVNLFDEL